MKQALFETKDRAEELLKEAINIWKANYHIEDIEGLDKDPVFLLFLIALAYRDVETQSNWNSFKNEFHKDLLDELFPLQSQGSLPTTMIVKSDTYRDIDVVDLNSSDNFKLNGTNYNFIPLFKTRIISHSIKSITRMDGRRWKLVLSFSEPIKSIEGFSFQILDTHFDDVNITYKKEPLAVVKPWDISDLPFAHCFSIESMIYQPAQLFEVRSLWFDLFAEHNARLFVFKENNCFKDNEQEITQIELIFEFTAINKEFSLNPDNIIFNTFPMVNVSVESVDLSHSNPIYKVADDNGESGRFLTLIPNEKKGDFLDSDIIVRKFNVDRFGVGDLLKLTDEIVQRFSSDFYAYQSIPNLREGGKIEQLRSLLNSIKREISTSTIANNMLSSKGTYIMLKHRDSVESGNSVRVRYLLTNGDISVDINDNKQVQFTVPSNINGVKTKILQCSSNQSRSIKNREYNNIQSKYLLATNDRLVTLSDIKMFCYKELFLRYSISKEYVVSIDIKHRFKIEPLYKGYEIAIFITLQNCAYTRKRVDDISFIELLLQKMIENRLVGIYPAVISIIL